MSDAFNISKAADLDRMIAQAVLTGFPHHAELLRRVRAGRINMMQLDRSNELHPVANLGRGYTLYREPNGAGGHTYWSDAIDGGVIVWDTSLVSRGELEAAMRVEAEGESADVG